MIHQDVISFATNVYYGFNYGIMEQVKNKLCDEYKVFNFESLTDVNGDGTQANLYMNYKNTFRIFMNCNYGTVSITIYNMNNVQIGGIINANCYLDDYHAQITLNVCDHDKSFVFGFTNANQNVYYFSHMFAEYQEEFYISFLPNTNTALTFYKDDGVIYWTLTTMLNILVSGMNKGLFRAFMPSSAGGYCDIYHQMDNMYNINTGYPFTINIPVTVNDLDFIPLNNYTLYKID